MIHLLPPLSLDGRFSTQDLPNELQLTLLNNMVVPRIVSSSLSPSWIVGSMLDDTMRGMIMLFRRVS